MPHLRRTTKRNPPRHSDPVAAIPAKRRQDLLADADRFLTRDSPIVPRLMALEIPYTAAMRASFRQIFHARRDDLDFNLEWRTPYEDPRSPLAEQHAARGYPRSVAYRTPNPSATGPESDISFEHVALGLIRTAFPQHNPKRVIWLDERGFVVSALPHVCPPSPFCDAVFFYRHGTLHVALDHQPSGGWHTIAVYYPRKPNAPHQPVH